MQYDGIILAGTRTLEKILSCDPAKRVTELKAQGIEVFICGAISRPLEIMIISQGIEVHSFDRGSVYIIV
jgi:predicted Fe-Mo cluster-binding NifX family protein